MNAPPLADETIAQALDELRLDEVSRLLAEVAKYAGGAALAADAGDLGALAVRTKQTCLTFKEAVSLIAELGSPEPQP
jgi:hypothetical protein